MVFIFIIFFSLSGHSLELKHQEGRVFSLITYQKMKVSSSCQKKCLALEDYSSKFQGFKSGSGNPASEFCNLIGGEDLIVSHPNLDQDSLCLFKDKSYILSWDLFRRNQKEKK